MKYYKNYIKNVKSIILEFILQNRFLNSNEKNRLIYRSKHFRLIIKSFRYKKSNCVFLKSPIKIFDTIFERKPIIVVKENKNEEYFLISFVHEYIHLLSTSLFYKKNDDYYYISGVLKYIYDNKLKLKNVIGNEEMNEILTDIISKYVLEKSLLFSKYVIKDEDYEKKFYNLFGDDIELIMAKFLKNKL